MAKRQTDKRDRLIQTAESLVYQQGYHQTTLAQIAQHAEVPLGTVYYFFKTKEALGQAVVERYLNDYQESCQRWNCDPDPRGRLEAYVQMMLDRSEHFARSGCPTGTLCTELHKQGGELADQACGIFEAILIWLTEQFRALGKGEESEDLAVHLLSAVQGAALLAQSFHSPDYIEREVRHLKEWIRTL